MGLLDKIVIGNHESIVKIKEMINAIAPSDISVLISGASGVGKSLIARCLHAISSQNTKPFIEINCASTPEELLKRELFGYERGYFDHDEMKQGQFELANGGSIFLDEFNEISLGLQVEFLKVLQENEFSRLGGEKIIKADCRFIVSTTANLEKLIKDGLLREDLYYRLNVVALQIPPLRKRIDDLEPLFEFYANQFRNIDTTQSIGYYNGTIPDFFYEYSWPGNVRELKQITKSLIFSGNKEAIRQELLTRNSLKPAENSKLIAKYIEFPPELHQSGISILTYFGTIIRKKYHNTDVKIRIEQDELKVRMIIETPEGLKEEIEKSLREYGQVVSGEIMPEAFFVDKMDVIELKQLLNIAKIQIETQKELLSIKDGAIRQANQRISFLEVQYSKLQDILCKSLDGPDQGKVNWETLITQNHTIVQEALNILKEVLDKGITSSDEERVKSALRIIKKEKPDTFTSVVDMLKTSVSGAAGNLLYHWITFVSILPK